MNIFKFHPAQKVNPKESSNRFQLKVMQTEDWSLFYSKGFQQNLRRGRFRSKACVVCTLSMIIAHFVLFYGYIITR